MVQMGAAHSKADARHSTLDEKHEKTSYDQSISGDTCLAQHCTSNFHLQVFMLAMHDFMTTN